MSKKAPFTTGSGVFTTKPGEQIIGIRAAGGAAPLKTIPITENLEEKTMPKFNVIVDKVKETEGPNTGKWIMRVKASPVESPTKEDHILDTSSVETEEEIDKLIEGFVEAVKSKLKVTGDSAW